MRAFALGTMAWMGEPFAVLERIIAIKALRRNGLQFFAGRLDGDPDMFQMAIHLFFHYPQFLGQLPDGHRPLPEQFDYLPANRLHG